MIISSYFSRMGNPAVGLYPLPTIRIWEIDVLTQTLVVTNQPMLEVGDGFYKYEFGTFDPAKGYVCRVDGGYVLSPNERFNVASFGSNARANVDVADIVNGVWGATASDYTTAGSMGNLMNQTHAVAQSTALEVHGIQTDIQTVKSDIADISATTATISTEITSINSSISALSTEITSIGDLMHEMLKYESNRTKIDAAARTLTVYDDDGITPIRVFSLRDQNGIQSVTEVYERVPL